MRPRIIKRSPVYYLINTIAPINHVLKAKYDAVGSMLIIILMLGCLSLMRMLLSNTQ